MGVAEINAVRTRYDTLSQRARTLISKNVSAARAGLTPGGCIGRPLGEKSRMAPRGATNPPTTRT
jgi:hypothetical protein